MGLITKLFAWYDSAAYDDNSPRDWFCFVLLVVIASFLWSRVIKYIVR